MRATAERWARRWWAGELGRRGAVLGAVAAPLAWGWGVAVRGRERRLRDHPPRRVDGLHVVSVGNLAVGGTGKTPVAAWVADRLQERGLTPAVVVGRAGADEAALHTLWRPGRLVVSDRDRARGAERARARGARAIVLDDAFQHRGLARDVDVVLLSADDPFPGPLLPRGPYRELPHALARADAVVVTRRRAEVGAAQDVAERAAAYAPGKVIAAAEIAPVGWRPLGSDPDGSTRSASPRGSTMMAVCGVARADCFRLAAARASGADVELIAFSDHHAYTHTDVARLHKRAGGRPIAMTEKDAVKLRAWEAELGDAWVLVEELRWTWGEAELAERVAPRRGA